MNARLRQSLRNSFFLCKEIQKWKQLKYKSNLKLFSVKGWLNYMFINCHCSKLYLTKDSRRTLQKTNIQSMIYAREFSKTSNKNNQIQTS